MKKLSIFILILFISLISDLNAGKPTCWVAVFEKYERVDDGRKHLCHGDNFHFPGYDHIPCVESIMGHIQNAGIEVVLPDLTNYNPEVNPVGSARQWEGTVNCFNECIKRGMTMAVILDGRSHVGGPSDEVTLCPIADINSQAKRVWDEFANPDALPGYEYYNEKPLLIIFNWTFNIDGRRAVWWEFYAQANAEDKTYLEKFTIELASSDRGTSPAEAPWGWHNSITASGGNEKVRFITHNENGGEHPSTHAKIPIFANEYKTRVEWCKQAEDYSIYGSYGLDNPFGQGWSIQDGDTCSLTHKLYPEEDPYYYYNVIKNALNPELSTTNDHQIVKKDPALTSYPNPFVSGVTIKIKPDKQDISCLKIYNLEGKLIRVLKNEEKTFERSEFYWNGCDSEGKTVNTGLYIGKILSEKKSFKQPYVLLNKSY